MLLRPYQDQLRNDIFAQWHSGRRNVLAVLPTGGGKTVIFGSVIAESRLSSIAIAHRRELIGQMSLTLARQDMPHRIIAPSAAVRQIVSMHVRECGMSYYNPQSPVSAASVDTLLRRDDMAGYFYRVQQWVMDEGHHLLRDNKWGKALERLPNARGLLVTATSSRADGRGLGRHASGVADVMVQGPQMRALIDDGYLTDYRVVCPRSDIRMSDGDVTASGDYSPSKLKAAAKKSKIVGDTVENYIKFASGMRTIVFATDVETGDEIARKFRAAGVAAEMLSAKTPDTLRDNILQKFRRGEFQVLVNVDLFGEGFDLPAVECVIMARPTESYGLFVQQFGRALRLMIEAGVDTSTQWGRLAAIANSKKPRALIIDQVGNIERHGLPDAPVIWSMDDREKAPRKARPDDELPLVTCLNPACVAPFFGYLRACPECGTPRAAPVARSGPELVDGDLVELDPDVLRQMRGEIARVDMDPDAYRQHLISKRCPSVGLSGHVRHHVERQAAQQSLRDVIAHWAGYRSVAGLDTREQQRLFYVRFGIDVLSAQALEPQPARALIRRVASDIFSSGY